MRLEELPTPAALVELERVERNASRMRVRTEGLGVRLRPHVKTHKCLEAARLQLGGSTGGITVSTLAEARAFAAGGFRDITWALPIPLGRVAEAAQLSAELEALQLLVDHPEALAALEAEAARRGARLSVFLKVDCGYHRAGVDPADPASLDLARRIHAAPGIEFAGVLTHAGHSYACRSRDELLAVAAAERDVTVGFAERLRAAGIPVPTVSVGSTPTLSVAEDLRGVDEVRPGNYLFYDRFQATLGACALEDAAFSVLATVIGRYPRRGTLVIDAGALALSKDPGPSALDPDCGYGALFALDGTTPLPHLRLIGLSQEHGTVRVEGELGPHDHPLGSRLRVLANHSCLAVACHEVLHVVRGGARVATWRPARGW